MFFPAIDALRDIINKAATKINYSYPVVLDCSKVIGLDYTSAEVKILYLIQCNDKI